MTSLVVRHMLTTLIGLLGNFVSVLVYLAPVPTFLKIYQRRSTQNFSSLPYSVSLFSSTLWLIYGLMQADSFLLVLISSFGCFIQTIYLIIYMVYAPPHVLRSTLTVFGGMNVGIAMLIFLVIHFAIPTTLSISVLGWICTCASIGVFAAPLSVMIEVIDTQSVRYMPFTLSLSLTVSAVIWFWYGILLGSIIIYLPNVIGFMLGAIQLALFLYYSKYGVTEGAGDEEARGAVEEAEHADATVVEEEETHADATEGDLSGFEAGADLSAISFATFLGAQVLLMELSDRLSLGGTIEAREKLERFLLAILMVQTIQSFQDN